MNLRRILQLAAALAAVAAAAAVCVVAASLAVYGLARLWLTPAGSAAVVAALFAFLAVLIAWAATRKAVPPKTQAPADDGFLIDRLVELAKQRPLIALGAAAAAVTVILKNPRLIAALVSAFAAGAAAKPDK